MTIFEQEVNKTEATRNFEFDNENALEWITGDTTATITLSQKRLITRVEKLAQEHPKDVQIVHRNRSSIVAHIPAAYIKLQAPREYTEEQARATAERLAAGREKGRFEG